MGEHVSKLVGHAVVCLVGAAALLSQPATAIDLNGSVSLGGISAGLGAKVDRNGISAGATAEAGSISAGGKAGVSSGGISAGANAAAGPVSAGTQASVSGSGISAGANAAAGPVSTGAQASVSGGGVKAGGELGLDGETSAGIGVTTENPGAPPSAAPVPAPLASSADSQLGLPGELVPRLPCGPAGNISCSASRPGDRELAEYAPRFAEAITVVSLQPTAPIEVIAACREGIIQAALPFNPVRVDAVSAGGLRTSEDGGQVAPLVVRIVYDRAGGYETREAEVSCRVDDTGAVVSLA
jgi:hypothetical protein